MEAERSEWPRLGDPDVFCARALRTLARHERDGLTFAKLAELPVRDRRLVKEILLAVRSRDESKPLLADEPLDRSSNCRHVVSGARSTALRRLRIAT